MSVSLIPRTFQKNILVHMIKQGFESPQKEQTRVKGQKKRIRELKIWGMMGLWFGFEWGRVQCLRKEEAARREEGVEWDDGWEYLMGENRRGLGKGLKAF